MWISVRVRAKLWVRAGVMIFFIISDGTGTQEWTVTHHLKAAV